MSVPFSGIDPIIFGATGSIPEIKSFSGLPQNRSEVAVECLQRIAEMYAIENEIRGESAEVRLAVRQAGTAPLIENFGVWLKRQRAAVSPKCRLSEKLV